MTTRRLLLLLLAFAAGSAAISCTKESTGGNIPAGAIQLSGAGATFPAPLYKKWMEEYKKRNPRTVLSYDAVGSGEGIKRFIAGAIDFGASDAAMSDEQMTEVGRGVQLIPATAGILVLAYNPDGIGGGLCLKRGGYLRLFFWLIKKRERLPHPR